MMFTGEVIRIGRELYRQGLNDSHSGNISFRQGDFIYITKSGRPKGEMGFEDVVRAHLNPMPGQEEPGLSVDAKIHRAIYQKNPAAKAIVHAHPPHVVVVSLDREEIIPVDQEGPYYFKRVPVLTRCDLTIGSECVASNLPDMFIGCPIVAVRGHGTYAVGRTPDEAYKYTSVLENVCRIIYLVENKRKQ